jgi:hypothetical protein
LFLHVAFFPLFLAQRPNPPVSAPWDYSLKRARILRQLKETEGKHLVVVRYGPEHSSAQNWVYNEADIDAAKVVWAREMDAVENRRLFDYFKGRHVWLLQPDGAEPTPKPYPIDD